MSSKVIKDKYMRFFVFFEKQLFFKYSFFIRKKNVFLQKTIGMSGVKNHCVFTNRSRSVFKFFKCSRIFLRNSGLSGSLGFFYKKSFLFVLCSYGGMVDTVDSKSIAL